jgi:hypothetical protein
MALNAAVGFSSLIAKARMGMLEGLPNEDDHVAVAPSGSRLPPGVAGMVSCVASLGALSVGLHETPTAVYSFCGTCREVSRASLYGEAAWAVGISVVASVVARFVSPAEFSVARSAAVVAAVVWIVCVGFVKGWW